MKRFTFFATASLVLAVNLSTARAADVWFDMNGTTPGSGVASQAYDWNTDGSGLAPGKWNTDAGGVGTATNSWVVNDFAHFSAGTDATGVPFRMGVPTAGIATGGYEIEEGYVILSGGPMSVGANPGRIDQGATLEIPNLANVGITAGHILTIDGGTLRNTIQGGGSGIYAGTAQIQMTANGATFDTPNNPGNPPGSISPPGYSIMVFTGAVNLTTGTTTSTLIKKGQGELRAASNWQFTTLDVQEGFYRINGTGGTETGFGAATGHVITHGGAVENDYVGTALGTSITIASPATRSFTFNNDLGPDTMIVLNAGWTISGNIDGAGGLMLNGWTRKDTNAFIGSSGQVLTLGGTNTYGGATTINFGTLAATGGNAIPNGSRVAFSTNSTFGVTTINVANFQVNASETVGSLSGGNSVRGITTIASGQTLTTGADGTTSTYSGSIAGAGGLTKSGGGSFTMDGVKSYTGNTSVTGGTLSTNSLSLADAADVLLTTGALFNLNFSGPDTIHSLFIDNILQSAGTWGAAGSGATHISSLFSGTGVLNATVGPGVCAPGDLNCDSHVDAQDYVFWRKTVGSAGDYTAWRTNFGVPPGSGSGLSGGAVPEPASIVLLLSSLGFVFAGRRRVR